jgi:Polysaccharide deacetylase
MRSTIAACAILVLLGTANAEQCPPGALGVSRTLIVDPNEHPRVGSMQYPETLPLNDHEVVLTFDDGPLPRYTNGVLETLASECVKATFFMVGQMARAYPWMVRRVYDEGHTVANHTQNHPIRPAPLPKSRLISPIFTADSVSLHVSPEKDGKSGLVYARIGRCQGRPAWRGACAAVPRRYV